MRRHGQGALVFAALLVALVGMTAAGAGRWWWAMLPSVMPGLGWAALGLAALAWATLGRDALAAALAVGVVAVGGVRAGFTNEPPARPAGERPSLRVVAWNTHGWDEESVDRLEFLRFVRDRAPDLLLLHEAWLDRPGVEDDIRATWPGWEVVNRREWTTVSRHPVVETSLPEPGGFLRTRVRVGGRLVDAFNVHLETAVGGPGRFERRRRQLELLREAVAVAPAAVIGGDFNTPWHHPWVRDLRSEWSLANPVGPSLPLTVPSLLPVARYDYLFGSPGIEFTGYEQLVHLRQLLGHTGLLAVAHLPASP